FGRVTLVPGLDHQLNALARAGLDGAGEVDGARHRVDVEELEVLQGLHGRESVQQVPIGASVGVCGGHLAKTRDQDANCKVSHRLLGNGRPVYRLLKHREVVIDVRDSNLYRQRAIQSTVVTKYYLVRLGLLPIDDRVESQEDVSCVEHRLLRVELKHGRAVQELVAAHAVPGPGVPVERGGQRESPTRVRLLREEQLEARLGELRGVVVDVQDGDGELDQVEEGTEHRAHGDLKLEETLIAEAADHLPVQAFPDADHPLGRLCGEVVGAGVARSKDAEVQ
ncbi:hypothetical protein EGW08_019700, partial [Elysia chlorotica]